MARYQSVHPTTQIAELEAGDAEDPTTKFVHGTISAAGRAHYASAIGSFTDRAVSNHQAHRSAVRTGCPGVDRPLTNASLPQMQSALRCLARAEDRSAQAASGTWRQTSVTIHGDVSAARIWGLLGPPRVAAARL